MDTEVPVMTSNAGVYTCEINGNLQAIDLSYNPIGADLSAIVAPLASLEKGSAGGDPVGLSFLGLSRIDASQEDKAAANDLASEALPDLQLNL